MLTRWRTLKYWTPSLYCWDAISSSAAEDDDPEGLLSSVKGPGVPCTCAADEPDAPLSMAPFEEEATRLINIRSEQCYTSLLSGSLKKIILPKMKQDGAGRRSGGGVQRRSLRPTSDESVSAQASSKVDLICVYSGSVGVVQGPRGTLNKPFA